MSDVDVNVGDSVVEFSKSDSPGTKVELKCMETQTLLNGIDENGVNNDNEEDTVKEVNGNEVTR